ncbi:glycosyltransferase family 2 protein [Edaphobacter paludis]|uniref:Glycosyltransferase family 2 protein n=1 Tax=Edaphobacter paludis TaxID=3035702 RepID=A0AAU7D3N9_9BACT
MRIVDPREASTESRLKENRDGEPLITIAMPFFNAEQTLVAAVDSMLKQTYGNFELLLSDDGSSDRGLEIAHSFQDPRIRVFTSKQRGRLAVRLNECLDAARGSIFARMDADDISYPQRIEKQIRFLQERPEVDLLGTHMLVFAAMYNPVGKMVGATEHEPLVRTALLGFKLFHGTWMGHIDWFRKYRYNTKCVLGQDQELLYRAHRTSRYAVIPELLYGYRQSDLDLQKMINSRVDWFRYMSWYLPGPVGLAKRGLLAGLMLGKAGVDTIAVKTGLRYRLLRHRASPLSASQLATWEALCNELNPADKIGAPPVAGQEAHNVRAEVFSGEQQDVQLRT